MQVRLDLGDAQIVNCLRIAFNAAGLDFDLWNDGPVKGARVDWALLKPEVEYLAFARGNLPRNRRTDAQGQDSITIEGRPQKQALSAHPEPVDKPGRVHVKVTLKPANMVKDLLDAVNGPLSLPTEMMYRDFTPFHYYIAFNVVDWQDPCDPGAAQLAGRSLVAQAAVCADTWTGNSSGSAQDISISAEVTWKIDPELSIGNEILYYAAEGTVTASYTGCSVNPSSYPITRENGGYFRVDYGVDPPTYLGASLTAWSATWNCEGSPGSFIHPAGGRWFFGMGTLSPDGTTLAGTSSDGVQTFTYTFMAQ